MLRVPRRCTMVTVTRPTACPRRGRLKVRASTTPRRGRRLTSLAAAPTAEDTATYLSGPAAAGPPQRGRQPPGTTSPATRRVEEASGATTLRKRTALAPPARERCRLLTTCSPVLTCSTR